MTEESSENPVTPIRRRLPNERLSQTHKFVIAGHKGYLHIGLYPRHTNARGDLHHDGQTKISRLRNDGCIRSCDFYLAPIWGAT